MMSDLHKFIADKGTLSEILSLLDNRSYGNINHRDELGNSVLHTFLQVFKGKPGAERLKVLKALVESGVDLNCENHKGVTPLIKLLQCQYPIDHFELLFEKGAIINWVDKFGEGVLHKYAQFYKKIQGTTEGSLKMLKFLVERGADVNCTNIKGVTPLMKLVDCRFSLHHVAFLVEKGANVNQISKSGDSILHYFAYGYSTVTPGEKSMKVFKFLISTTTHLEYINNQGITPLILLILNSRFPTEYVRLMLNKGIDLNSGKTRPLNCLFRYDGIHTDILQMFLEYGVDTSDMGQYCYTYYHIIISHYASCSSIPSVRLLCNFGVSLNWKEVMWKIESYLNSDDKNADALDETLFKYGLLQDRNIFDQYLENPDRFVRPINMSKLTEFIKASLAELTTMKAWPLNDHWTIYDFLNEIDCRKLGAYVRSGDINIVALEAEFPIYAEVIRSKWEMGSRWAMILYKLEGISLSSRTDIPVELNCDCIYYITQFLNNYQVAKFVAASESREPSQVDIGT